MTRNLSVKTKHPSSMIKRNSTLDKQAQALDDHLLEATNIPLLYYNPFLTGSFVHAEHRTYLASTPHFALQPRL